MAISSAGKAGLEGAGQAKQAAKSNSAGKKDGPLKRQEFLKLLVSQLKNQNPLEPTKNKDFVKQLATMTNLERLQGVQKSIQNMAMAQSANTSAQVASFIGKSVQVSSNTVNVQAGQPTKEFGYNLKNQASDVTVKIKNEEGEVVREINKGKQSAGEHTIHWDGTGDNGAPVSDGKYTVEVIAKNGEGKTVESETWAFERVEGVSFKNGSPQLIYGNGQKTPIGDVQEIRA